MCYHSCAILLVEARLCFPSSSLLLYNTCAILNNAHLYERDTQEQYTERMWFETMIQFRKRKLSETLCWAAGRCDVFIPRAERCRWIARLCLHVPILKGILFLRALLRRWTTPYWSCWIRSKASPIAHMTQLIMHYVLSLMCHSLGGSTLMLSFQQLTFV